MWWPVTCVPSHNCIQVKKENTELERLKLNFFLAEERYTDPIGILSYCHILYVSTLYVHCPQYHTDLKIWKKICKVNIEQKKPASNVISIAVETFFLPKPIISHATNCLGQVSSSGNNQFVCVHSIKCWTANI